MLNSVITLSKITSNITVAKQTTKAVIGTFLSMITLSVATQAQSITEVITDYNGFWKSGQGAISTVKPDNSHNLVAFSYNNVRYSTGVNDSLLTARNETFIAGKYKALPVSSITGTITSNTKCGFGEMYDGVHNGASATPPVNDMAKYMTDGIKGLDLGTCGANLPVGDLYLPITDLKAGMIGDNVPDLVITQIADPSGSSLDSYEFLDVNGNRIGNKLDIVLQNLPVVGNWAVDFYEASRNPMVLQSGFTNTVRDIRLWAADLSTWGIDSNNVGRIAYFKISLNGNSDVAFVAYNENAFSFATVLPVSLTDFRGKAAQNQVELSWKSIVELNSDHFVVESSNDGINFTAVDKVAATGMSASYTYIHHTPVAGKLWYRLKQVDKNGTFEYSQTILVTADGNKNNGNITLYPNPATSVLHVRQNAILTGTYEIRNVNGAILSRQKAGTGNIQTISIQNLPAGMYWLVWNDGAAQQAESFIKR